MRRNYHRSIRSGTTWIWRPTGGPHPAPVPAARSSAVLSRDRSAREIGPRSDNQVVRAGPSRSLRDLDTGDLERRVLAAVGDAVVVLDLEGRIVGWEGAAERLLGHPAASVLGRPATVVFPPELVPGPEQLATIGGVDRVELVLPLTGDRIAAVSLAPLRDQAGQVTGATATVKPVGAWLD